MEIRQMRAEEAEKVSEIYASSWKAAYRGIVSQTYLDGLSSGRWAAKLAANPSMSYVLLEEGRPIGTSAISPARDEAMKGWGEVISLYLLPAYFGKGYGKSLLSFCLSELRQMGFDHIYLWALERNTKARAFYEKFGFVHDGQKTTYPVGGEELTEVRYIYEFNRQTEEAREYAGDTREYRSGKAAE